MRDDKIFLLFKIFLQSQLFSTLTFTKCSFYMATMHKKIVFKRQSTGSVALF